LLDFLRARAEQALYITSVCSGALLLGAAGLLRGYRATTHWLSLDLLSLLEPSRFAIASFATATGSPVYPTALIVVALLYMLFAAMGGSGPRNRRRIAHRRRFHRSRVARLPKSYAAYRYQHQPGIVRERDHP
jgi:hypothetical protein